MGQPQILSYIRPEALRRRLSLALPASTYFRGGATATFAKPALSNARRTVPSALAS